MVLEFLGSQTLLDVHETIVELTQDPLWQRGVNSTGNSDETVSSGGFFFIESIFYTTGTVDYTTPIQTWLGNGTKKQRTERLAHMGLAKSDSTLPIKTMSGTRLEDLELRLAMRYVHVHHGVIECSFYITDRKLEAPTHTHYPIIHDVWTSSFFTPDCEACKHRVGTVATSNLCRNTLGHRVLCSFCAGELGLLDKEIEEYSVWKGQTDLQAGCATTTEATNQKAKDP